MLIITDLANILDNLPAAYSGGHGSLKISEIWGHCTQMIRVLRVSSFRYLHVDVFLVSTVDDLKRMCTEKVTRRLSFPYPFWYPKMQMELSSKWNKFDSFTTVILCFSQKNLRNKETTLKWPQLWKYIAHWVLKCSWNTVIMKYCTHFLTLLWLDQSQQKYVN